MRMVSRISFLLAMSILAACAGGRGEGPGAMKRAAAGPAAEPAARLELQVRPVEGFLDSLGVCTHLLGQSRREITMMKEAGIRHLRDEISWSWVERAKDKLQIPAEREAWVDEAALQKIDILLILNYGNPIYMDQGIGSAKTPDRDFELFGRYVDFVVGHFKDRVRRWEIWNEPNGFGLNAMYGGDWRGGGWVEAYARLADATLSRVRAIDPGAVVMTAGMEAPIADLVVPHLKGDYDAIAVHPYCAPLLPEYAWPGIDDLRRTAEKSGHRVPFVVTEQGYPTVGGVAKFMWKHSATITQEDQARFMLRVYCGNFLRGIQTTYWYDLVCDGVDPTNQEHNFGLINSGMESPRPAYNALKTLTTKLSKTETEDEAGTKTKGETGAGPETKGKAGAEGVAESPAAPAETVLGRRASIGIDPAPSAPVRGLLLAGDSARYFLILWKESGSAHPLVVDGPNGMARAFHDDGAPETVRLSIPAFCAGRLVSSYLDPMLGPESETPLTVTSNGIENAIEVAVKESPVVVELRFE